MREINLDAAIAAEQILWDERGPVPPQHWSIVMIDPGEGDFSDLQIGEPFVSPSGAVLGYGWGDSQSLLRYKEVPLGEVEPFEVWFRRAKAAEVTRTTSGDNDA